MEKFIALIRKDDFVDLFKYGSLHINRDTIRKFSCPVSELPQKECIFNDLIYFSNTFESSFEYLFVVFRKGLNRDNDLIISDVLGIYPLDEEAKRALSISLDPRIVINDPIWPDAVLSLQKKHTFNGCKTGIDNIWKIYGLKDSVDSIRNLIPDNVIDEMVDEIYENRRPKGDIPVWVYIMRYHRHGFYPRNTIGYFMDTINVIFNYMQKREVDSSEIMGTMIMRFLQHCNDHMEEINFESVYKALCNEPSVAKILEVAKNIEPNLDILKTATLYYIFRDRYVEGFKYEENFLKYGLKNGFEFSVACYLLGATLGHEHTYDCLYSELPLPIFSAYDYDNEGIFDSKGDDRFSIDSLDPESPKEEAPNKEKESPVKEQPTDTPADGSTPTDDADTQKTDDTDMQNPDADDIPEGTKTDVEPVKADDVKISNDEQPAPASPDETVPAENLTDIASGEKRADAEPSKDDCEKVQTPTPKRQPTLFDDETPLEKPIPMKKSKKHRTIFLAKTKEEYLRMLDEGYIQASEEEAIKAMNKSKTRKSKK